MANETVMHFRHPNSGAVVRFEWHPAVAGQQRLFYESKGFVLVNPDAVEPEPAPEPEAEPKPKKKRVY